MHRGEVLQCLSGAVGRDAPGAVGDATPGVVEVLEQHHELAVVGTDRGHVHLGDAQRELRRELGVEARLARPHPGEGDALAPMRIEREQLAEQQLGRPGRLVVRDAQTDVLVGHLVVADDLDGRNLRAGVLGLQRLRQPLGRDVGGNVRDGGRLGAGHGAHPGTPRGPTAAAPS